MAQLEISNSLRGRYMKKNCAIFLCICFLLSIFNSRCLANSKCLAEIVIKNPHGANRFGAILDPPEGSDYSVWFPVVPRALDIDLDGNIYVGDSVNYRILKFDRQGRFVLKFRLQRPKREIKPELSHIIKDIAIKDEYLNVWNYFEQRIEVYTLNGIFVRFMNIDKNKIGDFFVNLNKNKFTDYYEITSYVPDKKFPGKILYSIVVRDKSKQIINKCDGVNFASDDDGLIYRIDKDGNIYTFDYYSTMNVIRMQPLDKATREGRPR